MAEHERMPRRREWPARVRRAWLTTLKHTLNRLTGALARWGHGPFSLIRTTGRKTGRTYETPLILAEVPDGFVAELTYGENVNWYRNLVAAGGGVVVRGRREVPIDAIEPISTEEGLRAFGPPASWVLRLLHRSEFRHLHATYHGGQ
ncbi:nitroreductase/quinone reductase family protein [Agromyces intestinalis]|nr:nitroreductase/quinone reductase family protein [Agromyces intestinalis]